MAQDTNLSEIYFGMDPICSGDINLSVTMTFFSSVAAFAMTSFWIWFLGSPLVDTTLPIPYTQLVNIAVHNMRLITSLPTSPSEYSNSLIET